jgi:hypothetical protein
MEAVTEIQYDDSEPSCPKCGASMFWDECSACGGEGWIEVYDLDPLWYAPDDVERCEQCNGVGGYYVCLSATKHEG